MSSAGAAPPPVALVTVDGRAPGRWEGPVGSPAWLDETAAADPREPLLLCPAGVELLPGAEARVREMLVHDPEIDLAYFDSVEVTPSSAEGLAGPGPTGRSCLRPGYSPDRLRAQDYLGPVVLIRREILTRHRRAGSDRPRPATPALEHGQRIDLADRCQVIAHLPQIVYRSGSNRLARPRSSTRPGLTRRPLVSVVMPTRGSRRRLDDEPVVLCLNAVDRLVARTDYRPIELVMVLTPGTPDDLPERLKATIDRHPPPRRPTLRICGDDRPFNFSNACNRGAAAAAGEVLVFLNDDTAVVSADWLDHLVARAVDPGVGAVGAKLLHGDGSIQHVGIWSRGGHPTHRYQGFRADHPGHLDSLGVAQNCLAVTGACLAVETDKFLRAGGFCPEFPSSYNDVDLCLKLDALGHRTVIDPQAVLHHYEASSRDPVIEDWEIELLHRRWRRLLIDDPYDNPNHLAPGADEFPTPDPLVLVGAGDDGGYGHPARIWTRRAPVTDLIDLERDGPSAAGRTRSVETADAPADDLTDDPAEQEEPHVL